MTQRAYAGALLHKGNTVIQNPGFSDDEMAALRIIKELGAKIDKKGQIKNTSAPKTATSSVLLLTMTTPFLRCHSDECPGLPYIGNWQVLY